MRKINKSSAEWKALLTPEQFKITREKGTEPPFTGKYWDCHERGIYRCVSCQNPLFASEAKFESGTGWPSFFSPYSPESLKTEADHSFSMERTEVICQACGAHLGHLFPDGPPPTRLRYCINSAALTLEKK